VIGTGRTAWSLEIEKRIREAASDFEKQNGRIGTSADELRAGLAAFNKEQAPAPVAQPLPQGLERTDKNADKIASDYAATILAKPSSSWTPEEKAFIRQSIGAYRGGE
jgi:hypothetical protein